MSYDMLSKYSKRLVPRYVTRLYLFCRLPAKGISPQFKPIFAKNGSKENYQQYYKSNLITYVFTLRASSHFFKTPTPAFTFEK